MIFLVKHNNTISAFGDALSLSIPEEDGGAGTKEPDLTITEEEWQAANHTAYIDDMGRIVLGLPPDEKQQAIKAAKLAEINAAADRAMTILTATYPDREIATFDKQEAEARTYAVDPTAPTPLLLALSQARGVELPELVRRVIAKADAFAVASGSIIGQRQALEDRLDACETLEEIEDLAVAIVMPGEEAEA